MTDNRITCEDCKHITGPIYTQIAINYYGPLDATAEWHFCPAVKHDWRVIEASRCRLFVARGERVQLDRRQPSESMARDRWIMAEERRIEQAERDYLDRLMERQHRRNRPIIGDVGDDGTPYGWDPFE